MSLSTQISSPFMHSNQTIRQLMLRVQLAAIPALLVHIYLFGFGIMIQWLLAVATLLIVEYAMMKLRNRPAMPAIMDLSALITITALVFCIPPGAPWWIIVAGTSFALIFGKHLYGGLGYNPFNPAMLGYAFLLISFPVQMTQWTIPSEISEHYISLVDAFSLIFSGSIPGIPFDMITSATPLDELQTAIFQGVPVALTLDPTDPTHTSHTHYPLGLTSWQWTNVAFVVGGLYLLVTRTIRWQYPVGFLASLTTIAFIFHQIDPNTYPPVDFVLLSGGTMLAAFFIITDPVSSATTPKGRLIFAAGIGILVYVIRTWGAFPDGIAFAILLMNITVPLIDQYTQPRVYGHRS